MAARGGAHARSEKTAETRGPTSETESIMNWCKRDAGRGYPERRFVACGLALLAGLASRAAAQDFGHEGPSFSGATAGPTQSKPESKLWFHDGTWWGSLWSTGGQAFHIHRLDQRTHVWADTGVPIDFGPMSKADALLDGDRLYIGSHRFSSLGGASGHPILFLRYGYDALAGSYALDPGFPVTIGSFSAESLVIDKDSTGTVWAAWVQGLRVVTCHSVGGDDLVWTAPAVLPGSDTDLTTDEVCSLIHFGGNQIGVMWSDQALNLFRFAVHQDGDPDDAWSLETPLSAESDDHINLATDAAGRVFAVVKNAANETKLLVRDAGDWSSFLVSTGIDRFTRPMVLLDEERRKIHVFASGQDNGLIHEKTASLDDIAFAPGTGTVVIRDASLPDVNDATSTKQNVDGSTGLVVLASHESTGQYWHHSVAPDALLVASFSATPLAGRAPLLVQFTDTSTGTPTSWSWDFGDGSASSAQHPSHVYADPGTYSVRLTVGGATPPGDQDEETWSDLVTVAPLLPTQVFSVLADARVNEANPGSNTGAAADLRVRFGAGTSYASYLRFDLASLSGPVASATLRLFCTDGSPVGGLVFPTTDAWNETTITWNNRPAATGGQIASIGSVLPNTWAECDVTAAIGAPGVVSFLLTSTSSNSAFYSSREGASSPELVIEIEPVQPLVAEFSASPTSGMAPLSVAFTDLSSGDPTSWSWDFGDGSGSTDQSPVHVYDSAGSFTVGLTISAPGGLAVETKGEYVFVTAPPAPEAAFDAAPTSGTLPLTVAFTDTSSGDVTAWLWDFGDGTWSSQTNPTHVYTSPGSFGVTLTVTGPGGSDAATKSALVSVLAPIHTLLPVADARVNQASPSTNNGSAPALRVLSGSGSSSHAYLRFDLSGLGGPVTSARLRLYCTDASNVGGLLFPTSSSWAENTITWNNKPAASGPQFGAIGAVLLNAWVEVDVTSAVTGSGQVAFLLTSTSTNSATYSSREGANPPQLVVETGMPQPPVADFSASPTAGTAPLSVAFTDGSGGGPTSWSWDFGDGTSSSVQNPLHVYAGAGNFTVTLTASNAQGSSVLQRTDLVSVTAPPPSQTLLPVADARVNQASPGTNGGKVTPLRVSFATGGSFQSYLRFDLSGLSAPPTSAKLRLFCTDGSPIGGALFPTSSSWSETTLTWNNKPAASGAQIAALGTVTTGAWVEVDVTSAIGAPGPVSFLLTSSSSNSALYSSREGAEPPQLVVETGTP
jgi:PKD repeat protein